MKLAVVCVVLAACGARNPPSSAPAGPIAVGTDRFPHALHTGDRPEIRNWQGRGVQCADCHDSEAVRAGKFARPGLNQHAPCDDCHKAEFGKPPGKICRVCHDNVDPFERGNSPLRDYPLRDTSDALAARFSHRLHLDRARMDAAAGTHVTCTDCHEHDAKTREMLVPGHKACARCHERAEPVKAALAMERCDGCHPQRDVALGKCNVIDRDLIFHHGTHEKDNRGRPVACQTCHSDVDLSTSRTDMRVPPMSRCAQCHEDARRTPDRVAMERCATCHLDFDAGTPPTSRDLRPLCD